MDSFKQVIFVYHNIKKLKFNHYVSKAYLLDGGEFLLYNNYIEIQPKLLCHSISGRMCGGSMKTVSILGRTCYIFQRGADGPVIFWGVGQNGAREVEQTEGYLQTLAAGKAYILAAYEVQDWNGDFSPWEASALAGMQDFAGGGERTLDWLLKECVPYMKHNYGEKGIIDCFLAGYSLAGLFSLWAFYKAGCFKGIACCSGSLWYPGWEEFMAKAQAPPCSAVYLSLGGREEHTRNKAMASVGNAMRRQEQCLREDNGVVRHKLEWNQGGHFANPQQRIAKGIGWLLQNS